MSYPLHLCGRVWRTRGLAQESALGTSADSGAKGLRALGRECHPAACSFLSQMRLKCGEPSS